MMMKDDQTYESRIPMSEITYKLTGINKLVGKQASIGMGDTEILYCDNHQLNYHNYCQCQDIH